MSTNARVLVGAAVFLVSTWWRVPHLHHAAWAQALLGFAALVIVPMLTDLIGDDADGSLTRRLLALARSLQLPAALLLTLGGAQAPGVGAVMWALPWAGVLLCFAIAGALRVVQRGWRPLPLLCRDVGLIYASVGAAWLGADRVGFQPLGFDPAIVLLTAVHFHYAGLILPVIAGLVVDRLSASRFALFVGAGVIAGVPAVAVGITASQLHLDYRIELAATLLMSLSGLGLAGLQVRLALQHRWPGVVRNLWVVAGCSLAMGMLLAALYGVRNFFHPWPWLDIPWMRALHGSINALGFGFCGVLGWWRLSVRRR